MTAARHLPVMVDKVVCSLAPGDGEIVVDATFGAGGYSKALLGAAACKVFGIDRDADAIGAGADIAAGFGGRLDLIHGCFSEMETLLRARGVAHADGVTMDLGVSSMQIDEPARGFSFQHDGPLDMRMDRTGPSAADVVNSYDAEQLADIIYRYGDERRSRAIARAIVAARATEPITRTAALARIVAETIGGRGRIHPATRTFQALRIYVNDELGELSRGLCAAERLLAPEGRLVVVAFHSLEDRAVKQFLQARSGTAAQGGSRHLPNIPAPRREPSFRLPFRGAKRPSEEELRGNPRARSARLRAAIRTDAPAWDCEAPQ